MARRTSRVRLGKSPAITITRAGFQADELVYIAKANKRVRYPNGRRSAICYIGRTGNGVARIASSAVWKGGDILSNHGIRHLEFYVITAQPKSRVNIPLKLERALLMRFCERYQSVPLGNTQGKRLVWKDELDYFAYSKLDKVLDEYS